VILVHIPFIGKGLFGVDIFFVISGLIICYISSLLAASVIAITACFLLAIASIRMGGADFERIPAVALHKTSPPSFR
jgi:hypothetical protein